MNTTGYRAEAFPLQGPTVQHTVVNVHTDNPNDHIVWSLCNLLYSNPFCIGLVAVYYSFKARDRKMFGDMEGARNYASTARCLNIVSTVLIVITILIFIALSVVLVKLAHVQVTEVKAQLNRYGLNHYGGHYSK
ncbi:dispanin subfamily A member 2b-like [Scomber japonicus]|uniref:dispanin subfamily A member 2b-like n=1 Tax=Scomber japonicus TaxID=13676 RepID=UPI002305CFA0|nr:dispanin subfamily A member 2b-like [Scomber japonicus]